MAEAPAEIKPYINLEGVELKVQAEEPQTPKQDVEVYTLSLKEADLSLAVLISSLTELNLST